MKSMRTFVLIGAALAMAGLMAGAARGLLPGEVTNSGSNVSWDRSHHNADQIVVRIGFLTGS